ncbi:hypothetical protein [Streptomyces decoyicus]
MIREQWEGGEWELYCRRLLAMRHDSKIQFVPARDGGDGGLEAFRTDGVAYQCYAPQEAFSIETQTASQKKKIYKDIKRLCDDVPGTLRLLGSIKIHTWILMTPQFDSRTLVEYARKKSSQLLAKKPRPQWCADSFEILVITDEEFASEKVRLLGEIDLRLHLEIPYDHSQATAPENTAMIERLDGKLKVDPTLGSDSELRDQYRGELLTVFLRGQAQMAHLQQQYPTLHLAVERRLRSFLSTLTMKMTGLREPGPEVVVTLAQRLQEGLMTDAPGLSDVLAEQIAWYAISDWLIRCPLRFRGAA